MKGFHTKTNEVLTQELRGSAEEKALVNKNGKNSALRRQAPRKLKIQPPENRHLNLTEPAAEETV